MIFLKYRCRHLPMEKIQWCFKGNLTYYFRVVVWNIIQTTFNRKIITCFFFVSFFNLCTYLQFVLPHGFIVFSCLNLKMYNSNVCHPDEAWCLAICKQITAAIRQSQHLNVLYWSSIDLVVDKYKLNFCLLLPHSWLDSKCFNLFQITNYFTVTLPLTCLCWCCGRFLFYTS